MWTLVIISVLLLSPHRRGDSWRRLPYRLDHYLRQQQHRWVGDKNRFTLPCLAIWRCEKNLNALPFTVHLQPLPLPKKTKYPLKQPLKRLHGVPVLHCHSHPCPKARREAKPQICVRCCRVTASQARLQWPPQRTIHLGVCSPLSNRFRT